MVHVALCGGKPVIDGQTVFADEVRDDRVAVADRLAVVDDVGKLPARGGRGVEDVLMGEWHASQFEESEYFEAVAVVVGDAEKLRVGIKRDQGVVSSGRAHNSRFRAPGQPCRPRMFCYRPWNTSHHLDREGGGGVRYSSE